MEIAASTGSEAYVQLLTEIINSRGEVSPRGFATREILNVTVTIEDGTEAHVAGTARQFARRIAATETIQLLAGISSLEQLNLASNGRFAQFADDGRLRGAYGPRTHAQLSHVIHLLATQPDTRQAHVTIWNGQEQGTASKDVPCTTGFQFLIRDGKLHVRVTMRSSDVFLGIPYDWLMFSRLQMVMAECLNVGVGSYTHVAGSQHLYERDLEQAYNVVEHGVENRLTINVPPALSCRVNHRMFPEQNLQRIIECAAKLCLTDGTIATTAPERWYRTNVPKLPTDEFGLCLTCRYVLRVGDMASEWKCLECEA